MIRKAFKILICISLLASLFLSSAVCYADGGNISCSFADSKGLKFNLLSGEPAEGRDVRLAADLSKCYGTLTGFEIKTGKGSYTVDPETGDAYPADNTVADSLGVWYNIGNHELVIPGNVIADELSVSPSFAGKTVRLNIEGLADFTVESVTQSPQAGKRFDVTFVPLSKHNEYGTITVTVYDKVYIINGSTGVANRVGSVLEEEYTSVGTWFDPATGRLSVPGKYIDGKITVSADKVGKVYSVSVLVSHADFSSASRPQYGTAYTSYVIPRTGYVLPKNITVKVDGDELETKHYSYDTSSGRISVFGTRVRGDIEITALCERINAPFTADTNRIGLWIALTGISLVGIAAVVWILHKSKGGRSNTKGKH